MADDQPGSGSGRGGIYAILVVIIVLLVGGILFIQQRDDGGPDIEIEVPTDGPEMPDPDVDAPDVEVPEGGGEPGG